MTLLTISMATFDKQRDEIINLKEELATCHEDHSEFVTCQIKAISDLESEIESLRSKIKMRDLEIEYEQGEHYEWERRARFIIC